MERIFKGIFQYTSEQFDGIKKQPGFIYLVRKNNDKNDGDAEIWFGNRRYGTTSVSDLELRNIGAIESEETVTVGDVLSKLMIAKDILNDEEIFFKSHADATYMSDGSTVTEKIQTLEEKTSDLTNGISDMSSKFFVGTQEEYDEAKANGKIGIGALVIILDDGELEDSVISLLGTAILGKMILGQK